MANPKEDVYIDGRPLSDYAPSPFTAPNYQVDPLTQPTLQPPANGQVVVPSVQQMVALLQAGKRYYFQSDQAVRDSQENAMIMERNLSIAEPLQSRMLSVCQMPLSVVPPDMRDKKQMAVAQALQGIIEEIPNLFKYKWALAQAIWYGRSAVQNIYDFDRSKGYKRLCVKDWIPIHPDNLVYKWDSNVVGLRVGVASGNSPGTKEVYAEPADFSRVHPLDDHEREAHVVHTHLLLAGNFLDPYAAGNVKGTGIRNVIYWTWYLQNQCLGMLVEFLERMGLGFTVVTFQAGNAAAYAAAQTIAQAQSFNNVITFPRWPGQDRAGQDDIYRIEPTLNAVQNFMGLIRDYWGNEMRRYIVGQDSTSQPVSTGLGSEIAAVQESTFFRLVKMDCLNLEETLTQELLWVIQKYTFPELDFKCRVKINTTKPDMKEWMQAAKDFVELGGTVIENEAREVLGMTPPTAEDKVLGGVLGAHGVVGQEAMPEDTQTEGMAEENNLKSSVGGSQALLSLQQAVYSTPPTLPRAAAIANCQIVFGFSEADAASLFPEIDPGIEGVNTPGDQPEEFAHKQMSVAKKKVFNSTGRWVTTEDGTHLLLGSDGTIQAGPAALEGKNIDNLKPSKPSNQTPGGNKPQTPTNKPGPQKPGGNKPQTPTNKPGPQKPGGNKPQASTPKPTAAPVDKPQTPKPSTPAAQPKKPAAPVFEVGAPVDVTKFTVPDSIKSDAASTLKTMQKKEPHLVESVEDYTAEGYESLNKAMRSCPPSFGCVSGDDKKLMDNVEKAIAAAPPFKEPVTVYRGINMSPEEKQVYIKGLRRHIGGEPFEMPSITSTSLNPKVAKNFGGGIVFQVKAKSGLYVESVTQVEGEQEIIKSAKNKYKVHDIMMADYGGKKISTVYLEEI